MALWWPWGGGLFLMSEVTLILVVKPGELIDLAELLQDGAVKVLFHRMYSLISFRKSTPPQNRQLIVYYY